MKIYAMYFIVVTCFGLSACGDSAANKAAVEHEKARKQINIKIKGETPCEVAKTCTSYEQEWKEFQQMKKTEEK